MSNFLLDFTEKWGFKHMPSEARLENFSGNAAKNPEIAVYLK